MRRSSTIVAAVLAAALGCAPAGRPSDAGPAGRAPSPPAATGDGLAVVSGQAPVGAVVALEPIGAEPPLPPGPVIMDQYSRTFIPSLLLARVGQVVEFRNSEDVDHNIRVLRLPAGTTVMDVSGSQNQVFTHTFDQAGHYDVSCDVHPGMRATIVATRTPYAVGTDERGAFAMAGVPPGRYRVRVSAGGLEQTRDAQVDAPQTTLALTRP